jgi:hypothetical protein
VAEGGDASGASGDRGGDAASAAGEGDAAAIGSAADACCFARGALAPLPGADGLLGGEFSPSSSVTIARLRLVARAPGVPWSLERRID